MEQVLDSKIWNNLSKLRQLELKKLYNMHELIQNNYNESYCKVPFDMQNIISMALSMYPSPSSILMEWDTIIQSVIDFTSSLVVAIYGKNIPKINNELYQRRLELTKVVIYIYLSSKNVRRLKISKEALDFIFNKIIIKLKISIVAGGEHVGVTAASSLAAMQTQATLDTFHYAGVATKSQATQHMDTLKKIFQASENPGSFNTICFPISKSDNRQYIKNIIKYLDLNYIRDIADTIQLIDDPNFSNGVTVIPQDAVYVKYWHSHYSSTYYKHVSLSDRCLRIKFNLGRMFAKKISITNISHSIKSIYPNISIISLHKNIIRLFIVEDDNTDELDQFTTLMKNIVSVKITGIKNITGYDFDQNMEPSRYYDNDRNLKIRKEYKIYTTGINLLGIFNLSGVDIARCVTNDIRETYKLFGIESARNIIFDNIKSFYMANGVGNYHQMGLVADFMTCKGRVTPLSINGLRKMDDIEPLQKLTYEHIEPILVEASITGSIDTMRSPSSTVTVGQRGQYGSGYCHIIGRNN